MNKASKTIISVLALAAVMAVGLVIIRDSFTKKDLDISDWKTYQSEQYGFEMKYPPDWIPQEVNGQFAGFYDASYGDEWLEKFDEAVRVSAPEVIDFEGIKSRRLEKTQEEITLRNHVYEFNKQIKPNTETEPDITELKTMDSIDAIRLETYSELLTPPGFLIVTYIPISEGEVYIFNARQEHAKIFDQMISTFKLLD